MSNKVVTVYTKPSCVQCDATKRWLDSHGYKDGYALEDAIANVDALKQILDVAAAPVVKVFDKLTHETTTWTGYNPDLLKKHLEVV